MTLRAALASVFAGDVTRGVVVILVTTIACVLIDIVLAE